MKSIGWVCLVLTSMDRVRMVFVIKEGGGVQGQGEKKSLSLSFSRSPSLSLFIRVFVRVCVCVCVCVFAGSGRFLAASILNVVNGPFEIEERES